jgi:hypothetical protein
MGLSEIQLDTIMHIWLEGGATDAFVMNDKTAWSDRAKSILRMYNASGVHVSHKLQSRQNRR